jgi:amino acid transporter
MAVLNEEKNSPPVNFIQEGIKIGLINGAIALLLLFGSYYLGFQVFVDTQLYAGFVPYMMLILIVFGLRLRKRNGNRLSFKEALQFAFISYVVATVILAIGTYILFNVIDHTLTERTYQAGLAKTRDMMQRMGAPQSQIDDTLDKAGKQKNDTSVKTVFLGVGWDLIISFVKSILVALIIRREKPQSTI